jgi:hypothetical protein
MSPKKIKRPTWTSSSSFSKGPTGTTDVESESLSSSAHVQGTALTSVTPGIAESSSLELVSSSHPDVSHKEMMAEIEITSNVRMREKVVSFLGWAYGGTIFATFVIFFLQGFKVAGFNLDTGLLMRIGIATVGEIAGLAALVYGALFRKRK